MEELNIENLEVFDNKNKKGFSKSKEAFLSIIPRTGAFIFSGLLKSSLRVVHGDRFGFVRYSKGKSIVFLVKYPENQAYKGFRVIDGGMNNLKMTSKSLLKMFKESFWIPSWTEIKEMCIKKKTYRVYVDTKNTKHFHDKELGVDLKCWQVYDLIEEREDMSPEMSRKYADFLRENYKKVTN